MDLEEIESTLREGLGDCRIEMQADDNRLMLMIVGEAFEGLSRVKRQQLVYGLLDEKIASGEIHALSMRTLSPSEAQESDNNG